MPSGSWSRGSSAQRRGEGTLALVRPGSRLFAGELARLSTVLPYEDLPPFAWVAILRAVDLAWDHLHAEMAAEGLSFADVDEPDVTMKVRRIMNRLRADPEGQAVGFSGELFEQVAADAPEVSFDGTHLAKRPDLAFRLRATEVGLVAPADWALFTECKFVDSSHPVNDYCEKGIARFVRGEYAWAMPRALMLAYAARGQAPDGVLLPHLHSLVGFPGSDAYGTSDLPATWAGPPPGVLTTVHARPWRYPGSVRSPGPIMLAHRWLAMRTS